MEERQSMFSNLLMRQVFLILHASSMLLITLTKALVDQWTSAEIALDPHVQLIKPLKSASKVDVLQEKTGSATM